MAGNKFCDTLMNIGASELSLLFFHCRLMKPGTKESRVVNEVLLEVSCCAQDSTAYELSVVGEAGCKKIINADITKALDALGLIKVVRSIRNKGGPFIIQSTTSDLPKVMFALYMVSVSVLLLLGFRAIGV